MLRWIKWIAALVIGLSGIALFALWLVASSSILAKTRGDLTARFLTGKLGQVVEITGGVVVDLGSVLHVTAEGLVLPSQSMNEVDLARIGQLEFDVVLRDLIKGRINLFDIHVAGAEIDLIVDKDGTSSWTMASSSREVDKTAGRSKNKDRSVKDLLAGQGIRFSNSGVTYKDARNGLDLGLLLSSLNLSQQDGSAPVVLQGAGTLNGQELSLNGDFPPEQPFKVTAAFSQIILQLDGTPDQGGYDSGYSAAISVKIAEMAQLLEVLKLEKSLTGAGHVSAVFKKSAGSARIEDLDVLVNLDGGQSLKVTGTLGKLGDPSDLSIDTSIRLYTEAGQPPPTSTRTNLKLTGIDMQLIAQPDGIPHRRMVIETNGFVLDTSGVGPPPIAFSQISRTADGHLRIGKLVVRLGPPENPFLVFDGSVADALRLKGVNVGAVLSVPVASIIAPELLQATDVLGHVSGGFRLKGNAVELGLFDLTAATEHTSLLNLNVSGSIGNILKVSDVVLNIEAEVPSGAELLTALNLEPIKTGPVKLTSKLSSHGTEWTSRLAIAVAESQLGFNLDIDADDPNPVVRGQIESDLIKVDHLRDIAVAMVQLAKLDDKKETATQPAAPADSPSKSEDAKATEPLILPKPGQPDPVVSEASEGAVAADTGNSQQSGPFRDVTLQPLGRSILLSGMDVSITIDLRKIEGEKGTSSLKSDLEMQGGKARFGPLKVEYGNMHFDIAGSLDLNEDPDLLKLSGSTGGWDFGKIMRELKFKKGANGIVNASFDVSGSHASVRGFLTTLSGDATVSMRNGSIHSQLLDLAGLGVIPWLFSKKKGPTVPIICARAPLYFSDGRISTKQTVVETDRVQIVVLGDVNLKNNTLNIVGQPRRIGKPLSRSPWPFTAVGPIAKPKIKVKDGPRRLRRSDGATTMPQRRRLCVPDILQLK